MDALEIALCQPMLWSRNGCDIPGNLEDAVLVWAADNQTSDPMNMLLNVIENVLHPVSNGRNHPNGKSGQSRVRR